MKLKMGESKFGAPVGTYRCRFRGTELKPAKEGDKYGRYTLHQPYVTHPRLDIFVGNNSKHPMDSFGCTGTTRLPLRCRNAATP